MKKSVYKSAMSHVKTSENFKEATYAKLMQEMQQADQTHTTIQKERVHMETAKKRKVTGWTVGIAACAMLTAGIFMMNQPETAVTNPPVAATESQPPIMARMAVNIDGVISEVSEDGKSFKVGDVWVTITDQTTMGSTEPTAGEPSEEFLQKEFKVGNIVSGYTSQDLGSGQVTADAIYNNMLPAVSESTQPAVGKAAVNIDGVISEVSEDGKSFKVGDLWVTITPETEMGIDGPTAAEPSEELLQPEFKVGNIVSGFTSEDVSTGKVNATRIYNNIAPQN